MTGERSTNNFGRRGEEEKEKEEETVPSLREGRGLAAFPGPASQRRAEISGNRLTIFLRRGKMGRRNERSDKLVTLMTFYHEPTNDARRNMTHQYGLACLRGGPSGQSLSLSVFNHSSSSFGMFT
ncbi:unnamed protein product [Prorocentrum cordatum]|uniref:Uncharacterized protein n=1 Tax=Prorocentrum cordatum TaxID=2364126 RepID=A0ABN9S9Q2_9DINO|nr:unnamed protein product [Polarella glacialis]